MIRTTILASVLLFACAAVAGVGAAAPADGPVLASHDATQTNGTMDDAANSSLDAVDGGVPQDLDGDGRHEDLNANDERDLADVVVFFQHREDPAITDHVRAYDFNGNGDVELADAVALFGDDVVPVEADDAAAEDVVVANGSEGARLRVVRPDGQHAVADRPENESVDLWVGVGQRVAVDASNSTGADGTPERFEVTDGDDETVFEPTTGFRYGEPGTYEIEVSYEVDGDYGDDAALTVGVVPRDRLERNGTRESLPGSGTAEDPYRIDDVDDLRRVEENRSAHYELVDDVDADRVDFEPIGSPNRTFTGHFDGNGHAIRNLTVTRADSEPVAVLAPFAAVGEGGIVEGVALTDARIEAPDLYAEEKADRVAGLVGRNRGVVRNASVEAGVYTPHWENTTRGGIVARNDGLVSRVRFDGRMDEVGGGIAGVNHGTVERGLVNGTGVLRQFNDNEGMDLEPVGTQSGTERRLYFATDVDNYQTDPPEADVRALQLSESRGGGVVETMPKLDFEANWTATRELPVLSWRFDGVALDGVGTAAHPYEIETARDLRVMGLRPAADYALVDDVDASATASWNDGRGLDPIGDADRPFTGTLDGNGHAITGLTIDRPDEDRVGLFGHVGRTGRVADVRLANATITGGETVGAVAGVSEGSVERVGVDAAVTGTDTVGGAVGLTTGRVETAAARGSVEGERTVGGLAGSNAAGRIANAYAAASVSGVGAEAGGLVGDSPGGTVTDAYWDRGASGVTDSDGGTGLATDALTGANATENLEGFDFETAWNATDGYPKPGN